MKKIVTLVLMMSLIGFLRAQTVPNGTFENWQEFTVATTTYFQSDDRIVDTKRRPSPLPANHKFSSNDVVVITLQPRGTGDFLGVSS